MLVFQRPFTQGIERRHQVDPSLGELILDAGRDFGKGGTDNEAVVRQVTKLFCQHVLRDARKKAAQLAEPPWPGHEAAYDLDLPFAGNCSDRPLKAHDVDRLRAGTAVAIISVNTRFNSLFFHTGYLNSSYLQSNIQGGEIIARRFQLSKVLITGGSGFLGSYCILQSLLAGHEVRSTVRSLDREPQARAMLANGGAASDASLTFMAADLTKDAGWATAVANCDYVLHVASPFPSSAPQDENELIVPARDGALRVLRAARDAGVRRVVLTSSFAAIGYGHHHPGRPYTEKDWTEEDAPNQPYIRSKTIAERAAWDFIAREGSALELTVINPTGIFGPVLGADYSASIGLIKAMLEGAVPAPPDFSFGVVDVRDAADLHLRAMTHPDAKEQRFLAVSGAAVSVAKVAHILRQEFGTAANRIPDALLDHDTLLPSDPAKCRDSSNAKARRILDWSPRPAEEAVVASARSLLELGLCA